MPPREFGLFLIPEAPNEDRVILDLVARARTNTKRPSQQWVKVMGATHREYGYPIEGERVLHVDVAQRFVEVTEAWGGVITARKILPLGTV